MRTRLVCGGAAIEWAFPSIDALARATARVPMGRIGEANDVAGLALLLTSPAGSFINGKVSGIDGGASEG